MNIFWDSTITFSRQKSGVFISRKLPSLVSLDNSGSSSIQAVQHESPVLGPLWIQLCVWNLQLMGLWPSHPNETSLLYSRPRTSLSIPGMLPHLLGFPETWLSWELHFSLTTLPRGNYLTVYLKGCKQSASCAPHCYFQTITLTQSYLKTKQKKYPTPLRLMSSDIPSTPPLHTIIYWFSTTCQSSDSRLWLSLLSIPGSATSCVT